ncbi:hypothetical protein J6590_004653 [Homalodisca vitripennis]|nr:hypothetical protein J6590_004653 [Homalodisca vitripennis]
MSRCWGKRVARPSSLGVKNCCRSDLREYSFSIAHVNWKGTKTELAFFQRTLGLFGSSSSSSVEVNQLPPNNFEVVPSSQVKAYRTGVQVFTLSSVWEKSPLRGYHKLHPRYLDFKKKSPRKSSRKPAKHLASWRPASNRQLSTTHAHLEILGACYGLFVNAVNIVKLLTTIEKFLIPYQLDRKADSRRTTARHSRQICGGVFAGPGLKGEPSPVE